jgi:hypothetical protein
VIEPGKIYWFYHMLISRKIWTVAKVRVIRLESAEHAYVEPIHVYIQNRDDLAFSRSIHEEYLYTDKELTKGMIIAGLFEDIFQYKKE